MKYTGKKFNNLLEELLLGGVNLTRSAQDYPELLASYFEWKNKIKGFLNTYRINPKVKYYFYLEETIPLSAGIEPEKGKLNLKNEVTNLLNHLSQISEQHVGKSINGDWGKEPIIKIEFVSKDIASPGDTDLIINGNYEKLFKINARSKNWAILLKLIRDKIGPDYKEAKSFFDYFNGKSHRLVSRTKYLQSQLLKLKDGVIFLTIQMEEITPLQLRHRVGQQKRQLL